MAAARGNAVETNGGVSLRTTAKPLSIQPLSGKPRLLAATNDEEIHLVRSQVRPCENPLETVAFRVSRMSAVAELNFLRR
jgi:hypothetical protein